MGMKAGRNALAEPIFLATLPYAPWKTNSITPRSAG